MPGYKNAQIHGAFLRLSQGNLIVPNTTIMIFKMHKANGAAAGFSLQNKLRKDGH